MPVRDTQIHNYQVFINGEWRDAASGAVFDSDDPFTGATWARIPRCAADDVDAAVAAARP